MLDLSLAPGPIVFHLPDILFSPVFVLLCVGLNNYKKHKPYLFMGSRAWSGPAMATESHVDREEKRNNSNFR